MTDNNSSSGGISFTGLLLVALIVLKLCNVIDWSWWWVLSPAWIPAGIALLVFAGYGVAILFNRKKIRKVVNSQGQIKSKWEQRLEEMQATRNKAEAARNQKALDETMTKNKGDEFRANNIV